MAVQTVFAEPPFDGGENGNGIQKTLGFIGRIKNQNRRQRRRKIGKLLMVVPLR